MGINSTVTVSLGRRLEKYDRKEQTGQGWLIFKRFRCISATLAANLPSWQMHLGFSPV